MIPSKNHINTDAIIIGGGFGGCASLYNIRQLGLSVKLIEAGSTFGGVWHWNRYPGARVDSEEPSYQFSIPAVWKDWNWTERFPGAEEICRYFAHVDNVLELGKDAFFNTVVNNVRYDISSRRWTVNTNTGLVATCKFLISATGASYKKYCPKFEGLDDYQGASFHTTDYPSSLDVTGKRVAVIGNGASAIQLVQSLAKQDCELNVFIRTPSFTIPMGQRSIPPDESEMMKGYYDGIFDRCFKSESGFPHNTLSQSALAATKAQRNELFDRLWARGGYSFLVSNYYDFLLDERVNSMFYDYWAGRVRRRMANKAKMDIAAPLQQQIMVGTKRPSLEIDYYEMIDRENVSLHDLQKYPIMRFDAAGLTTGNSAHATHHDLDVVIFATGFDAVTGSLLDLGLADKHNRPLSEIWKDGVLTHLGMTVPDTPNFFMIYGPQAPTSWANGPPFIEMQVKWICDVIIKMQSEKLDVIECTEGAAKAWRDHVHTVCEATLISKTESWYMGSNIPHKIREPLVYFGGIQTWWKYCQNVLESWDGFNTYRTPKSTVA